MQNLQSVVAIKTLKGTRVSPTRTASSPFMQNNALVVPSQDVCVSSFAPLKTRLIAPFRITVRGVDKELQDLHYSQQGNDGRYIKLVDAVSSTLAPGAVPLAPVTSGYLCRGKVALCH